MPRVDVAARAVPIKWAPLGRRAAGVVRVRAAAPVAVLNEVPLARGVHELSVQCHVSLRAATVEFDAVKAERGKAANIALVVDLQAVPLATRTAVLVLLAQIGGEGENGVRGSG